MLTDKRLHRILSGPKVLLLDEQRKPVMHEGRVVTGWEFIDNGRWCFIADMGMIDADRAVVAG